MRSYHERNGLRHGRNNEMKGAALFLILCLVQARADDIAFNDCLKRAYEKRKAGNPAEALADYDKAIELSPSKSHPYWSRGICYYELERWDLAVADFRKAKEFKDVWRPSIS